LGEFLHRKRNSRKYLHLLRTRRNGPFTHVNREFLDTEKHYLLERKGESTHVQQTVRQGENIRTGTDLSIVKLMFCCLHNRNDDNEDDDEEGNSDDKAHLSEDMVSRRNREQGKPHYFHIFPPSGVQIDTDISLC
jgi:hypothetical protein